ncbi:pectate lyase [Cellulophaga phage Nekkels_2]|nr:pectate lyase [Cellulophaga phage Nekkels_2]
MKKTIYILSILLLTISGVSAQTVIKIKQPNPQQITIADDSIKLNGSASVPLSSIIKPITLAEYNAMDAATKLKNAGRQIIDPTGTPTAISIVDGSVSTAKIANSAVSGIKILDEAITESKIADASVTESKLSNLVNDKINKIDDVIGDESIIKNYIYTEDANDLFVDRYTNGYDFGTGFNDDVSTIDTKTTEFISDPDLYRPVFGSFTAVEQGIVGEYVVPNDRHSLHLAALKAETINDVSIANAVASELLATVNANPLNTAFWIDYVATPERVDSNHQGWIQCMEAKKMLNSLNRIEDVQTVLTEVNETTIKDWIYELGEIMYNTLSPRIDFYIGDDWENVGLSYFNNSSLQPVMLYDSNGDVIHSFTVTQDIFNNRNFDAISFIHAVAVETNDLEKEHWARQYVKTALQYGLYSDGTWWELIRGTDTNPLTGVSYGWTSLGSMVEIAHLDAMTNHFPNDKLYNYSTVIGFTQGQTKFMNGSAVYEGTSTTDGKTEKSIFSFLKGQTNYYRDEANGGWTDTRFYKNASEVLIPLDSEDYKEMSVVAAAANLYYKNQDIYDFYMFDTSKGYYAKSLTTSGYLSGYGYDDMGPWGNFIIGSLWIQQEDNFFKNPVKLSLSGFTTDDIPEGLNNKYGKVKSLADFTTTELEEGDNRYYPYEIIADDEDRLTGVTGSYINNQVRTDNPNIRMESITTGEPSLNLKNTTVDWEIKNQTNGRFRLYSLTNLKTAIRIEASPLDNALMINYLGVSIGKTSATQALDVNGRVQATSFITTTAAPTTSTSFGVVGEIRYDENYIYRCTAASTWVRTPVTYATW